MKQLIEKLNLLKLTTISRLVFTHGSFGAGTRQLGCST